MEFYSCQTNEAFNNSSINEPFKSGIRVVPIARFSLCVCIYGNSLKAFFSPPFTTVISSNLFSAINIMYHPHTGISHALHPSLPMYSAALRSEGADFYGSQPRLPKPETAIVIEYSIGEPFNKSGNGIGICINVLSGSKRSHHRFTVQAVLKEHLARNLSRPRAAK